MPEAMPRTPAQPSLHRRLQEGPRATPPGRTARRVDLGRHPARRPDATPAGTPPPSRLPRPRRTRRRRKGLGRGRPGRGARTWGRQEGTRRPRYLLILCAKARRSAAAMAPRSLRRRRAHRPGRGHRRRLLDLGSRAGRGGAGRGRGPSGGPGPLGAAPAGQGAPVPGHPAPWGWAGETEARGGGGEAPGLMPGVGVGVGGSDSRGGSFCHLTSSRHHQYNRGVY